jgi:hypothetical protein
MVNLFKQALHYITGIIVSRISGIRLNQSLFLVSLSLNCVELVAFYI